MASSLSVILANIILNQTIFIYVPGRPHTFVQVGVVDGTGNNYKETMDIHLVTLGKKINGTST